jgi:hypothetical protein
MGGKCARCGEAEYGVLHVHHLNPATKHPDFKNILRWKWSDILIELEGCILLCWNCHWKEHRDMGYAKVKRIEPARAVEYKEDPHQIRKELDSANRQVKNLQSRVDGLTVRLNDKTRLMREMVSLRNLLIKTTAVQVRAILESSEEK